MIWTTLSILTQIHQESNRKTLLRAYQDQGLGRSELTNTNEYQQPEIRSTFHLLENAMDAALFVHEILRTP